MQRKRARDAGAGSRGRGASARGRGGAVRQHSRGMNEVISLGAGDFSDEEEAQPLAHAAPPEATLEDIETADEKRIRLARAYLGTLARQVGGEEEGGEEEEEEEEDDDAARGVLRPRPASSALRDAITQRLQQDAQLISGAYFRPLASRVRAALPGLGFSFTRAHSVRLRGPFSLSAQAWPCASCPCPHAHAHAHAHAHPRTRARAHFYAAQLPVTCIAVSGDGRSAVSGSKDCCLLRWRLPEEGPLEKVGKCPGRLRTRADIKRQLELSSKKSGLGVLSVRGGTFGGGRLGPLAGAGASAPAAPSAPKIFRNVGGVSTIIAHIPTQGAAAHESLGTSLRTVPDYGIGGHWGEVLAVAMSSDGAFIASGGKDKTVRVWDGKDEGSSSGGGGAGAASGSAGGAAGSSSSSSRASGAPIPLVPNLDNFVGHKDAITSLAFLPNTHTLFSAGLDRLVKQWGLDEMAHMETLFGHQAEISSLDVAPLPSAAAAAGLRGKERAVTCSSDRTARLWKLGEGTQLVFRAAATCGGLECVRAITDSLYVTGAANGALSLWSSARKRPIFTLHCAHGTGMGVPEAGVHAPSAALARARAAEAAEEAAGGGGADGGGGSGGGGFAPLGAVVNLATDGDGLGPPPALLAGIAGVTGCDVGSLSGGYCAQVTALALMPQADVLVSGSGDGVVRFWRLCTGGGGEGSSSSGANGGGGGSSRAPGSAEGAGFCALEHIGALPLQGIVNGLAFSADGRTLLAAVGTEHRLGRWWKYSLAMNGVAVLRLPALAAEKR